MVLEGATARSTRMCRVGLLAVELGDLDRAKALLLALETESGDERDFHALATAIREAAQ